MLIYALFKIQIWFEMTFFCSTACTCCFSFPSYRMTSLRILLGVVAALTVMVMTSASTCNEAQCASLVTKCMLLQSCECDMSDKKNCPCCKDCHRCLSQLYAECCSCVGKSWFPFISSYDAFDAHNLFVDEWFGCVSFPACGCLSLNQR